MRKESKLNVAEAFAGHPRPAVFMTAPHRFVTKHPIPWLFLGALAGVAIIGAAAVAILINTL